jgi:hypothetical protein
MNTMIRQIALKVNLRKVNYPAQYYATQDEIKNPIYRSANPNPNPTLKEYKVVFKNGT